MACACERPYPDGVDGPIVVLVHGTWARHAEWADPDGRLGTELVRGGAVVVRHCWSGRNRHRDRLAAAAALRARLGALQHANPKSWLHVVAHSHGGNVALYALGPDPAAAESLASVTVTTLATPFLHARPRPLRTYGRQAVLVAELVLAYVLLFSLLVTMVGLAQLAMRGTVIDELGTAVLLCLSAGWLATARPVSAWLFGRGGDVGLWRLVRDPLDAAPERISATLAPDRLTIIRGIGDEAGAGLGTSQLIAWLWGVAARLYRFDVVIVVMAVATVLTVGSIGRDLIASGIIEQASWSFETFLTFGAFLDEWFADRVVDRGVSLLGVLVLLPITVMLLAMHASSLPFGMDGLFLSPAVVMTAETTPVGAYTVIQVEGDASGGGLAHSLYEDESVVQLVVDQIAADRAG